MLAGCSFDHPFKKLSDLCTTSSVKGFQSERDLSLQIFALLAVLAVSQFMQRRYFKVKGFYLRCFAPHAVRLFVD